MPSWLVPLVVALSLVSSPAPPGVPRSGTAPSALAALPAPQAPWSWPLEPRPTVTHPFVRPATAYGPGHRGVDLTPAGTSGVVHSPAPGVVTFAGALAGRGVMVVSHAGGLRSTFEPVDPGARVGASVVSGQAIAVLSTTPGPPARSHCAPVCLHWGVIRGSAYVDPLSLLTTERVVLLPLH